MVHKIIGPIFCLLSMVTFLFSACAGEHLSTTEEPPLLTTTEARTVAYNRNYDAGKVEVVWGNALFEDPQAHRAELALVAAALCAAAADSPYDTFAADHFIVEAYRALGFSDTNITLYNYPLGEECIVHNSAITTADGKNSYVNEHCFAIGYVDMAIDGVPTHVIVVTLRGTGSAREVAGDCYAEADRDFGGYRVYDYWADYAEKVRRGVEDFAENHPRLESGPVKMLVCGHSLGGAAAALFGADLDRTFAAGEASTLPPGFPVCKEDLLVFTFGALNVFDVPLAEQDFAAVGLDAPDGRTFDNILNIFNELDTYGPGGDGIAGFKPGNVKDDFDRRFGRTITFRRDDRATFTKGNDQLANHNMPCYIRALREGDVELAPDEEDGLSPKEIK